MAAGQVLQDVDEVYRKASLSNSKLTSLNPQSSTFTKEIREIKQLNQEILTTINDIKYKIENTPQSEGNVKSLEKELDKVKQRNDELESRVQQLEKELKESKQEKNILALGQVPWIFEQEIAKFVLPPGERENVKPVGALEYMHRYLTRKTRSDARKEARKRWQTLKKTVKWSDKKHEKAILALKDLRVPYAHPSDVNLEVAKEQVGNIITLEDQKSACRDLISLIETVRASAN